METWNKFLRAEKLFFLVKILKFFDADPGSRIQDGKNSGLGSGIQDEKIWIQDLGSGMEKIGSGIWDLG
jgi:hypothetical protein